MRGSCPPEIQIVVHTPAEWSEIFRQLAPRQRSCRRVRVPGAAVDFSAATSATGLLLPPSLEAKSPVCSSSFVQAQHLPFCSQVTGIWEDANCLKCRAVSTGRCNAI